MLNNMKRETVDIEGKMITIPNKEEMDIFNERHPLSRIHREDRVIDKTTGKIGTLIYQSPMIDGALYSINFDDGSYKDLDRKNLRILELGHIGLRESNSRLENIREEITQKVNVQEYNEKYEATSISLEAWQKEVMDKLHNEFKIPKEFISFHATNLPKNVDVCINAPSISAVVGSYTMYSDETLKGWNLSPLIAKKINEGFTEKKSHLDHQNYRVIEKDGVLSIEQKYLAYDTGITISLSKEDSQKLNEKLDQIYLDTKSNLDYYEKRQRVNAILSDTFGSELIKINSNVIEPGVNTLSNTTTNTEPNIENEQTKISLKEKFKNFITTGKDTVKIALLYASLSVEIVKDKFENKESNNIDNIKSKIQSIRDKHSNTATANNKVTL